MKLLIILTANNWSRNDKELNDQITSERLFSFIFFNVYVLRVSKLFTGQLFTVSVVPLIVNGFNQNTQTCVGLNLSMILCLRTKKAM